MMITESPAGVSLLTVDDAAAAIQGACSSPSGAVEEWETEILPFRVSFKRNEKVYFVDTASRQRRTPKTIVMGASFALKSVSWKSWDGRVARGHGIAPFNNCRPFCGAGTITPYSVDIKLSKVKYCGGPYRYVRLTYIYDKGVPKGARKRNRISFGWQC